ncbi:hypothetical protein PRIPAC_87410 [Pristionchus pacificus]|uniref:Uncharacterized protein n=1 Tax=Pristionchus pacificus TaxID=54126 RepID=A0A2A6CWQ4_PRIPA|nr:hypothetical protein PRIPAC_87410 [Pristionchus pacificus]|eukprot:PDM82463.1 hypothetical protein PRIPAC_36856 [Pristionchus pacificus]
MFLLWMFKFDQLREGAHSTAYRDYCTIRFNMFHIPVSCDDASYCEALTNSRSIRLRPSIRANAGSRISGSSRR